MIIPLLRRCTTPLLFLRSLGHGLPATPTNVFLTSDTGHATVLSKCGPGVSESTPPLAELLEGLCAAQDHRVRGCAAFALTSFAKCPRSRAAARPNLSVADPTPGWLGTSLQ